MAIATLADRFVGMDAEIGNLIRSRRVRLGMTIRDLAEQAHVDRGRLAKVEDGSSNPRPSTLGAILSALDRLEEEMGMTAATVDEESGTVEFEVAGNFGVRVVVKGPVRDRAQLEESVMRLISRMQDQQRGATEE